MNAHETKKGFPFEPPNCAFPHNKFYACSLSVSLIFLLLYYIESAKGKNVSSGQMKWAIDKEFLVGNKPTLLLE